MWPFVVLQLMLVEPLHYAIIAQTICAINVNSNQQSVGSTDNRVPLSSLIGFVPQFEL